MKIITLKSGTERTHRRTNGTTSVNKLFAPALGHNHSVWLFVELCPTHMSLWIGTKLAVFLYILLTSCTSVNILLLVILIIITLMRHIFHMFQIYGVLDNNQKCS